MEKQIRICGKCKKEYSTAPALSREDNKTLICPECGTQEAIDAYKEHVCIFEKCYCEFARRKGNMFKCVAPSDEEMKCR